jgi:hypothetical protein
MATPRLTMATPRLIEFSFKHSKADSLTRGVVDSLTHRVRESANPRLTESESRRIAESESRFLITNISVNSKHKSERLERLSKGLIRNQFLQKPQKIRLISMSL